MSDEFREWYWQRVKKIIRDVFRGDQRRADEARAKLKKLEKRRAQTIFYHADPFEVAADLAGRGDKSITPEEKVRYQEILREEDGVGEDDLPKRGHLDAVHPED